MAENIEDNGNKAKNLLDSLGDALLSNFSVEAIGKVVAELDKGASLLLKQFGVGQEMAQMLSSTMADAVKSVRALGGDIKDVIEIQESVAKSLGRNVIISSDVNKDLYSTFKVTGLEAGNLVSSMKDVGISSSRVAKEMKGVVDLAAQSGVNAVSVSDKVITNIESLNKYNFEGGVIGLAKMAAQATMLRIDMGQTLAFAEKVFNPEGAIEIAAAMQRLGVAQSDLLDPLKLMDLSQNDPAELQNQITEMTKQFVQLNDAGNFEILPGAKRQLREISAAMGLPYEQLTKMALGSMELEDKMSKIRFPDEISESQQKMIANMAELGTGGKYEVQVLDKNGVTITKAIEDLTKSEADQLEKMANTAPMTMEELAKNQLSTLQSMAADIKTLADKTGLALAGGRQMTGLLGTGRQITTSIAKVASPPELESRNLRRTIDEGIEKHLNILERLGKNEISQTQALRELTDGFKGTAKSLKELFDNALGDASNELNNFSSSTKVLNGLIKLLDGNLNNVINRTNNSPNFGTPAPQQPQTQSQPQINFGTPQAFINNDNSSETSTLIDLVKQNQTATANNFQLNNQNNILTKSMMDLKYSTLKSDLQNNNQNNSSPIEVVLTHNIDLKTNGNVDKTQILLALKSTEIQQGMVNAFKDAIFDNGIMAPTSNRNRLMKSQMV